MLLNEEAPPVVDVDPEERPIQKRVDAERMDTREPSAYASAVVVQREWADTKLSARIAVLTRARGLLSDRTESLTAAISSDLARNPADTMVAEILPLLAAFKYLEKNASKILSTTLLRRGGRPFWLAGVSSEVQRVPYGRILVIAPYNYPLFLPGVQVVQALVTGNAVIWKPGVGGAAVARIFAETMNEAGLPSGLLQVTGEAPESAIAAIESGVDKVFFTGSAAVGRSIMHRLSETLTPSVMELSGCDAVVLLPGADVARACQALAFGLRLNGSATCMAPRRLLLANATGRVEQTIALLQDAIKPIPPVALRPSVRQDLTELLQDASAKGATIYGDALATNLRPIIVLNGKPEMKLASSSIFAPVLLVMEVESEQIVQFLDRSLLALTVSVFGSQDEARELATRVTAGTVLINDLIVPTADPRVPFGGRRQSGFGVTRGREGLLEMTAVKVVSVRRGKGTRQYQMTSEEHGVLFRAVIRATHANTWRKRWQGLRHAFEAAVQIDKR